MKITGQLNAVTFNSRGGLPSVWYHITRKKKLLGLFERDGETFCAAWIWKNSDQEWVASCLGSRMHSFIGPREADHWVRYCLEQEGINVNAMGDEYPPKIVQPKRSVKRAKK